MEDTTLFIINYNEYLKLQNNHICWQILSRKIAENLFIKKECRESQFLLDDAESRYSNFIKEYPKLLEKKEAAIVNVSSGLGLVPKESAPVYCASKAGLHIFSKSLRYQLESTNVKLFEIIPSLVDTDMTKGRGKGKLIPEQLVEEFWKNFVKDKYEIKIGKVKLLHLINRISPKLAESIMKKGL